MNNKMMKLTSNIIKIITPKMTSSPITLNGVTFTASGLDTPQNAFNIDTTITNSSRTVHPYTLNFSRKILVNSYSFGNASIPAYNSASGYLYMYNGATLVYSTNTINQAGATYNITPVLVDRIETAATNSSAYANEGILGVIRGVNFTGLLV